MPAGSAVPARLLPGRLLTEPRTVLFVCVGNAGRSLMAEAIFNADPPAGWRAESAGTEPAGAPDPKTGPLLREIGLDLPPHPPQRLTDAALDRAPLRITMGCLDRPSCPARLRGGGTRDWGLADPHDLDLEGARGIRDEIRRRIAALRTELAARPDPPAPGRPSGDRE